ncbi:hypothetical protein BLNAU_8532 [Blattamonas nauphoetae]|uniref:G-protein coupled receptors family 2 profile 2 domain-containing protein n=1 Tax=Blattamonas nauphoetae TaxID=2049346 RepID=A0ABQ9XYA8_9EUKA|nr:hypothetical protein BLNAU_8532 [Blattamonas nauphoetae]
MNLPRDFTMFSNLASIIKITSCDFDNLPYPPHASPESHTSLFYATDVSTSPNEQSAPTTMTYSHCHFSRLSGPVFSFASDHLVVLIDSCHFTLIKSEESGGCIVCRKTDLTGQKCIFEQCQSSQTGGVLFSTDSVLQFYDCSFQRNVAELGSDNSISTIPTNPPEPHSNPQSNSVTKIVLSTGVDDITCGAVSKECRSIQSALGDFPSDLTLVVQDHISYSLADIYIESKSLTLTSDSVQRCVIYGNTELSIATEKFRDYMSQGYTFYYPSLRSCAVLVSTGSISIINFDLELTKETENNTMIAAIGRSTISCTDCLLHAKETSGQISGCYFAVFVYSELILSQCTTNNVISECPIFFAIHPTKIEVNSSEFINVTSSYEKGAVFHIIMSSEVDTCIALFNSTKFDKIANTHSSGKGGVGFINLRSNIAWYPEFDTPTMTDKYYLHFNSCTFTCCTAKVAQTIYILGIDLHVALHPRIHNSGGFYPGDYNPSTPEVSNNYFNGQDTTFYPTDTDLGFFLSYAWITAAFVDSDLTTEASPCGYYKAPCASLYSVISKFTLQKKHLYLSGSFTTSNTGLLSDIKLQPFPGVSSYTLSTSILTAPTHLGLYTTEGTCQIAQARIAIAKRGSENLLAVIYMKSGSLTLSSVTFEHVTDRYISIIPLLRCNDQEQMTITMNNITLNNYQSSAPGNGIFDFSSHTNVQITSFKAPIVSVNSPLFFFANRPLYGGFYFGGSSLSVQRDVGTSLLSTSGSSASIYVMIENTDIAYGWTTPSEGSLMSMSSVSSLMLRNCSIKGNTLPIPLPTDNPFLWTTSAILLDGVRANFVQSNFTEISEGVLSVSDASADITKCVFSNNSPKSTEFPDFHRNALCVNSSFQLSSPAGGDGVDSDSLWIRDDGCTFSGLAKTLQSPFFVPHFDTISKVVTETNITLTFHGSFPATEGLAFTILTESTSNEIALQEVASVEVFTFDEDSNTTELFGTIQRTQIDETQDCFVVLLLNGESVPSESGDDQLSLLTKGEWSDLFPDVPSDPGDPSLPSDPEEPVKNTKRTIVIIASAAGGGVVGVGLVVAIVGTAALRRRRRAQKEQKVEDEESESEESLDEILNVNEGETDASKEGEERVDEKGKDEAKTGDGKEDEKKTKKKIVMKKRGSKAGMKNTKEKKETDKPAADKNEKKAKKEKNNTQNKEKTKNAQNSNNSNTVQPQSTQPQPTPKTNELSLLSGKAVPSNQNTDTAAPTPNASLINGPTQQNKTLLASHHPNAARQPSNRPLLLSDTPFFNTNPTATFDVSEIPSRAHTVDSPINNITTILTNSGTTSAQDTERALQVNSFDTDRTQSSSKPRHPTSESLFPPPSKYMPNSIAGDATERNPQSLFFGLSMELSNAEDDEISRAFENPLHGSPSSMSPTPSNFPAVVAPSLSNYSLVKSHAKAHPNNSFLSVPSTTLPVLTRGQELHRTHPFPQLSTVSTDWGYERMYLGEIDVNDIPDKKIDRFESSSDESEDLETLLLPMKRKNGHDDGNGKDEKEKRKKRIGKKKMNGGGKISRIASTMTPAQATSSRAGSSSNKKRFYFRSCHKWKANPMTQLASSFTALSESNTSVYCPAANGSNALSVVSVVLACIAIVWFILNLISPERKLLLPLNKWFVLFHVATHAINVIIFILISTKNPAGVDCWYHYKATSVWVRVLLAIISAVCVVTGVLVLLPFKNKIFLYLNILTNLVDIVFKFVNLFGGFCSGHMPQQWKILQNAVALALLPTINFIALIMINYDMDFHTIKANISMRD